VEPAAVAHATAVGHRRIRAAAVTGGAIAGK
jgi:hypothetical protein